MKLSTTELAQRAFRAHDVSGLAAFRVLFGLLVAASAVRFELLGWVQRCFVEPRFYFHFYGFAWVRPFPPAVMHGLFVLMAVAGVCIALGLLYRAACLTFFVAFTYVELCDVTNYLNHYYLVSLVALLAAFLPLHVGYSLDARIWPSIRRARVAAWVTWLLRFQVGVVYFFAAIAKAQPDWLLHGQPLGIWLSSRGDLPLIGPLLQLPAAPLVMSWGGFLYDLSIPLWLSWRRTRPLAYLAVIAFHSAVGLLFPIGMFPFIMMVTTTIFFGYDWPRRVWSSLPWTRTERILSHAGAAPHGAWTRAAMAMVALYVVAQVCIPLRTFAYGGNVLWHEQGMRWSWRVMVREKNAHLTFRVRARGWSHERYVTASSYLTRVQEREMNTQPDLILALAHHVADDVRRRGHRDVEVRVDAFASLNGRPRAQLIDPAVDLAQIDDGLALADWILPAPQGDPPTLGRRSVLARGRVP